jgi:hypothetical protein
VYSSWYQTPILLSQHIPTAVRGTTIARIILVISDIIAIVVREFLPGSDIPHCNNPDGVMYYMIHVPLGIS